MDVVGGKITKRKFKISVFGEAHTGKTFLINFLKNEHLNNLSPEVGTVNYDNDQIFRMGQAPHEFTGRYQPTWGLQCHEVEQEITESVTASL